ncbi:MAG: LamG domain-containing protein [Spirochaetales bacterium]|nr:LamG domain-containing protein [Spirochaetales bacterium]
MNGYMNGRMKKISARLMTIGMAAAVAILIGACASPTGSDPAAKGTYQDDLASFTQAVAEIEPLPAEPNAAEIYTYAITVETLAGVYGISNADVAAVVTAQITDEDTRALVLGVLDGSVTLMDLMVADTGMYQDAAEQVVIGLPLEEEIPPDSPIQTNGTPEIVDDGQRVGMEFDDAEDYLLIPADPANDLTHDGTIEAWLKPDVNVNWAGIIHKGTEPDWSDEGYSFQYDGSKQLMLALTGDASGQTILVHTTHVLATGAWSHVVATWDGDEVHIYVNGVDGVDEVGGVDRITVGFTSTLTTIAEHYPFRSSGGDVVVGTQIPGYPYRFDGVMSGIRIYDRSMEESEVLENYAE